jgi:hypothetical protein
MDPAPDDVSFELERFGWVSEDRLEVAGRWNGVRHRLARPTLVVVVDGRRRRLRTLPGAWGSSPSGWEAAFGWQGGPIELDGAELEVGRSIVVELPRPRRAARSSEPEQVPAPEASTEIEVVPKDDAGAESELETARAEAQDAREQADAALAALEREQEELAIARRSLSTAREAEEDERTDAQALRSALEELRGKQERLEEELTGARSEIAAAQERVAATEERVAAAVAAGREEAQQLHEELARARTDAKGSQQEDDAEPPARRRFDPESTEREPAQRFDTEPREPTEPTEEAARSRRFNRAISDDRPTPSRSGGER